jgi:hypothetical protein
MKYLEWFQKKTLKVRLFLYNIFLYDIVDMHVEGDNPYDEDIF